MGDCTLECSSIRKIFLASNHLKNKKCSIEIQGTGKETRAFCYVDDAVEQLVCMLKNGMKGELYNIGMQKEINITPDLATFGKAIANGMPLSVVAGKKKLMQGMEQIFFSSTFGRFFKCTISYVLQNSARHILFQ